MDRRPERLEALRHKLREAGLDGLVVASPANLRYLTGFSGSSGLALILEGSVEFLSDFRYRTQAAHEIGDLARVIIEGGGLWEGLHKILAERQGVRRLGFEAQHLTAREAERLAEPARPWKFQGTVDLVESLRAVKSPEEVDAIRRAGFTATQALGETAAQVRPGLTEYEVAAILEGALRRNGSEWYAFPTIVASGPRSALPHARTSERVVAAGELLLLDFGAVVQGYCSDITRTFVVGAAPSSRQAEVHAVVQEAQRAAVTGLRAGLTGRQGDALARSVIEAAGLGAAFGHSLGHGVGLEVHEAPRLARTADERLNESAVVTVEPGIYLEGWGGVRIEDDVVLRASGAELLTEYDRELVRLG